jgi:branched-chain amino acid transport system substrate-binding protein
LIAMRALCAAPLLLLGACSFTTAQGFKECTHDTQCLGSEVCLESYCIAMPDSCRKAAGDFSSGTSVAFAALLPLSVGVDGGADQSEVQGERAIELVFADANQRTVIKDGRKFALYTCDTAGTKDRLTAQAQFFTQQRKVPALFISGSSQVFVAQSATSAQGTLILSATATSPELSALFQSSGGLVWRTAPSDLLQAKVMADFLLADPAFTAATRIGILAINETYGQGLSEAIATRLRGTRTVQVVPFDRSGDPTAAVAQLDAFSPSVTVLIGFPPDVRAVLQASATRFKLTRASGHRWLLTDSAKDPDSLTGGLSELSGSYGTAPAQGAGSAFPAFRDAFLARYSIDPETYSFTSHSYDAAYLLALASANAAALGPLTGKSLSDGLRLVSGAGAAVPMVPSSFTTLAAALQAGTAVNVEGASGPLDFDGDAGFPSSPIELWQVQADGTFKTVRNVSP